MAEWFSIYWTAPITAWLIAQFLKMLMTALKGEYEGVKSAFFSSGNMPSSHTAITFALLVVIAAHDGVHSSVFGIAFVLTSIVIYDALNVRRAVGEQGEALRRLAKEESPFYMARGHRPSEVIVGACIGLIVAACLLQIM